MIYEHLFCYFELYCFHCTYVNGFILNVLIYLLLGVSVSSLWPATPIGSFVMEKLLVPPPLYRKPHIFADAAVVIGEETTDKYDLFK